MKKITTMKGVYDTMLNSRCMINGRYVKTIGDVFEVVDELMTAEGRNPLFYFFSKITLIIKLFECLYIIYFDYQTIRL